MKPLSTTSGLPSRARRLLCPPSLPTGFCWAGDRFLFFTPGRYHCSDYGFTVKPSGSDSSSPIYWLYECQVTFPSKLQFPDL